MYGILCYVSYISVKLLLKITNKGWYSTLEIVKAGGCPHL